MCSSGYWKEFLVRRETWETWQTNERRVHGTRKVFYAGWFPGTRQHGGGLGIAWLLKQNLVLVPPVVVLNAWCLRAGHVWMSAMNIEFGRSCDFVFAAKLLWEAERRLSLFVWLFLIMVRREGGGDMNERDSRSDSWAVIPPSLFTQEHYR